VIPYPSLAGIANFYGAEVGIGPWLVMVESARVLDDYFRWYTGHRVYHDGFTQEGLPMGYAPGGDSIGLCGSLTWLPGEHGVQLEAERLTRVGVVEARGANLLALSSDEEHLRMGVSGWKRHERGWWQLTVSVDSVTGVDFIPGRTERQWRISLTH